MRFVDFGAAYSLNTESGRKGEEKTTASLEKTHMWTHFELLFAVVHLHVQAVRPVPVAVDDVCLAVAVKVSQSNPSSMLHGILHTCRYTFMCSVKH